MSELVVRRLLIDLTVGFPRRWAGGDAFRSALFNALSLSFPVGEQFFIDSLRAGVAELPDADRERFDEVVNRFIGQEATHRRIHALFNGHLEKQGHVNAWEARILRRQPLFDGQDVRHRMAVTVAYEHFTAILSEWLLSHPEVLDGAEPRLRTMWMWHASEESEHRSVAFDVYQALGGNHAWRIRWFRRATVLFLSDVMRQTMRNLWQDGALYHWSTWRSAARHLLGREGLLALTYRPWRAYFRPDFHPGQQDDRLALEWLSGHEADYIELRVG